MKDIPKIEREPLVEIEIVEQLIENALPDYQIAGSLKNGSKLKIRKGMIACEINIFSEKYLCYSYGANLRDIRLLVPLILSFFIVPVLLTLLLWYIFDTHFGQKAKIITTAIEEILTTHSIDLETYDE